MAAANVSSLSATDATCDSANIALLELEVTWPAKVQSGQERFVELRDYPESTDL
jgi:hypothetical protein